MLNKYSWNEGETEGGGEEMERGEAGGKERDGEKREREKGRKDVRKKVVFFSDT